MGIGETGVGEMGVGETGPNRCLHSLPCSFKSTVLPPDQIVMFNV